MTANKVILSLALGLAMSACTSVGKRPSPPVTCPVLSPAPPSLMQPPETEKKVRQELFAPPQTQTPKSGGSKK